jgi:hypothetical protein
MERKTFAVLAVDSSIEFDSAKVALSYVVSLRLASYHYGLQITLPSGIQLRTSQCSSVLHVMCRLSMCDTVRLFLLSTPSCASAFTLYRHFRGMCTFDHSVWMYQGAYLNFFLLKRAQCKSRD